jgi:hypothetical protein
MAGPIRQHFQHMCLRERGHVFENLLSEPEQLASYNTSALDQEWRGDPRRLMTAARDAARCSRPGAMLSPPDVGATRHAGVREVGTSVRQKLGVPHEIVEMAGRVVDVPIDDVDAAGLVEPKVDATAARALAF